MSNLAKILKVVKANKLWGFKSTTRNGKTFIKTEKSSIVIEGNKIFVTNKFLKCTDLAEMTLDGLAKQNDHMIWCLLQSRDACDFSVKHIVGGWNQAIDNMVHQ